MIKVNLLINILNINGLVLLHQKVASILPLLEDLLLLIFKEMECTTDMKLELIITLTGDVE